MDTVSSGRRSEIMRRVRAKNTSPELLVRRFVYGMGYRYRLHVKGLPGTPDLVFVGRRKVIFVHGCFWHAHAGCKRARIPQSNQAYWRAKISRNAERDAAQLIALSQNGWQTLVIWECELREIAGLKAEIQEFLDG